MSNNKKKKSTNKVAVIIPFYQKEKGILLRSVKSVFQQENLAHFKIFIVDDGSPIKARDELSGIMLDYPNNFILLEQKNSGPAKARNLAIKEARAEEFEYIAFLDSDDEWMPLHIDFALNALGNDKDFYFSDLTPLIGGKSSFERRNFPNIEIDNCRNIEGTKYYEYNGSLFTLILSGHCPISTPTVVFRSSSFDLLFREELTAAGEDYFFWLQVAACHKRIVFSTYKGVSLNYGVNLYESVKWGTNENIKQILGSWRFRYELPQYFTLTTEHQILRQGYLDKEQELLIDNIVHMLLHRKKINWRLLKKYCCINPLIIFFIPLKIIKTVFLKLLKFLSV